jgi:hypothetical protein
MGSEVQRGLLGLAAIGDEAREQVDEEIERAAVARVLDLADVLELVNNRLDERPLAQQEPIGELEELLAHVLAQFGDEAQSVGEEEALGERRRDGALSPKRRPNSRRTKRGTGRRSSVLPGVRHSASNSPRSLTTRCSLKP